MIASPEDKEKRRKALLRKKEDKEKRRNPIAGDYNRFRPKIFETNEKGGASNLLRTYEDIDNEQF